MVKRGRIVAFFLLLILFASTIGTTVQGVTDRIKLGLDLQGGFEILYKVKPAKKGDVVDRDALVSTVEALNKRINVLGVSEPNIQIEGKDRIRVQLAGVDDQNKAREILSTEAKLTFRDVHDNVLMDGSDLVEGGASQSFDQNNRPNVVLTLKDPKKFKEITQKVKDMGSPNNLIVIWLDFEEGKDSFQKEALKDKPKYLSAARVDEVLDTKTVSIEGGNFTVESAKQLADILNAGALPVQLDEIYSTSVGAQFGEKALEKTIFAGYIGFALISLFMIYVYRFPGLISIITLIVYIYLNLLIFDWMNAVLTLPGIAALILGLGMAVDANIITYERLKEELKLGKSVMSAFRAGNRRSLATIFDANITTILAGIVLFIYGTSAVKGFATMLIVSILLSFITAVYGTRFLLGLWVNSRFLNNKPAYFGVKPSEIANIIVDDYDDVPTKFDRIDFVKHSKKFFIFSSILVVVGTIMILTFKLNLGIDFASGTRVEILSNEPIRTSDIEEEFKKLDLEPNDIVISGDKDEIAVARFIGVLSKKEIAEVKDHFGKIYGSEPSISTVSPTVGKELARNAFIGVLIASIGIMIYVKLRFEMYMAIAAIVALLHDAFFIIAFFSVTRLEVDLTFIAAVLTIIGYSINDTIVTFDRIREIMKRRKKIKSYEELAEIVNKGLQQTFSRSINTVLTVVFTVIALLIFGSESIRNFTVALFVGLISGTYSSLFIAAQLWLVWKSKKLFKKTS
jgi:protein-export membrane protein SecD/preprotein translocase SecF subunit